jgi:hypothetical protein
MKVFFPIYLLKQFVFRLGNFIRHWYLGVGFMWWGKLLKVLSNLDKTFAVRITLKHWSEPLYQDRTIMGYILGFIFRTFRVIVGSVVYLFIGILFAILYLVWILIPIYFILKTFSYL